MKKAKDMDEALFLEKVKEHLKLAADAAVTLAQEELKRLYDITIKYRTLYDLGKLITSEIEDEALFRLAMDKVIEVTKAERGFIARIDGFFLDFKVARNFDKRDVDHPEFLVSKGVIDKVISDGQTIYLPDALADAHFGVRESVIRLQLLSILCTPIKIADQIVGIIYVDNSKLRDLFDETMAEFMTCFSEQLSIALKNVYALSDLTKSQQELEKQLRAQYRFQNIIGSSPAMTKILQNVANVADTDVPVLIQGENGTGKEQIARALHYNSRRSAKPLVTLHCGAIPESLVESELFGHEKGAYTGAVSSKKGKFELANGGTIFLDEIADMPPAIQVKLLRVLEEMTFTPLGSETSRHCDVRVIAATNRDVQKMVDADLFRMDLYYRLNVFCIKLPPLRERPEDILLLVEHFLNKYKKGDKIPHVTDMAKQVLQDYGYPGNIRQLENIIRRAIILSRDNVIDIQHLPPELCETAGSDILQNTQSQTFQERKKRIITQFEKEELRRILRQCGGKIRESARTAGMDVKNFSEKLRRYGINYKDFKESS
ncbi:GAF domain-containing protein [candidate division KSB1 bacterium]|nr:sigma 54-interacting transcriptional regulator [candidate division KSB1 bacterium]RQV99818.1 MAG: GAF domain-containing protein [candidate division KSB1 bacterium]